MKINFHTNNLKLKKNTFIGLVLLCLPQLFFSQTNNTINNSLTTDSSTQELTLVETLEVSPDAIESKVTYQAKDSIRMDLKKKKVYLYGNAEAYYEDITITAEIIVIDIDSNSVSARGVQDTLGKFYGEPVFTQAASKMKAHEIKYNFKTEKGLITEAMTHEGENYIHGEKIYKSADDILYIKHGKYTTCNAVHPHYYFNASKLKIIPDDKIITGPANLVIEGIPTPIGIPFGFFPNSKKSKSGLIIPSFGESGQYGFFLIDGGYYLAISDKLNMKLTGDFYTNGSWATNFTSDYNVRYKYNGGFSLRKSSFKSGLKEAPNYQETDDFFLRWRHNQDPKARPYSSFSANVNFGTSSNFRNDFNSSGTDYLSSTFNSSITYKKSWAGKPFNLTLNGYHTQNTQTKSVTVRLPEVAFNVSRLYPFKRQTMVGKQKFYEKIGISYSLNAKNEITAGDSTFRLNNTEQLFNDMKNGVRHTIPLSTSIKAFKHFTITPAINYSELWYYQTVNKTWDNQTNTLTTDTLNNFKRGYTGNGSINLTTRIYGMYQYRGKMIKALRHVITPSVGWSYIPKNNSGLESYTDSSNTEIEYSIFENGIYGTTNSKFSSLLNLSLINNFEMKVRNRKDSLGEDKKIKLLENLRFSSNFNLAADSLKWAPITFSGRTNLFKTISLNFNGLIDPYAIDSNGTRINSSQYKKSGSVGRLTTASVALSFALRSKKTNKKQIESDFGTEEELEFIRDNPYAFIDFNIPWTLNFSYNARYVKPQFESDVIQTLNFTGDFSLTQKWKVGFSSGYDFETKDLSYTSVDIYRDLHCWEMRFNWIPFGQRQSYLFTIKVKSALLQDLKMNRRSVPNVF